MNIQDAIKEVLEKNSKGNKYKDNRYVIRRKDINRGMIESKTYIYPTNSYDCCIIFNLSSLARKSENYSRYWNPTADDLMANDWEVYIIE